MAVDTDIDMLVKEEIEVYDEPVLSQDVLVSVKQECNKYFPSNSLIRPQRTHTADSAEAPYHCNQCDKDFSQNSTLSVHQRTHNDEKPSQFNQYDTVFLRNDNHIKPQWTHTGEKLYQCNQCD
ncbi:unnamed protein product, partial [Meganyctiphanes norvegica]